MLVGLLLALAAPTPDVLDVHPTAGPFASIAAAVAAAQDGDVIRVAPGSYGPFELVDKAVRVIASTPSTVEVRGSVRVRALAAGDAVVLSGLWITPLYNAIEDALVLLDCDGSVRIDTCALGTLGAYHGRAARIQDCADVYIGRSQLRAGRYHGQSLPAMNGIAVLGSRLVLSSTSSTAGDATGNGRPGGSAVHCLDSVLHVDGGSYYGGDGSDGSFGGLGGVCTPGGPGGHGILAYGASALQLRDVALFGGSFSLGCPGGASGLGLMVFGPVPVTNWTGPSLTFTCPALVAQGTAFSVEAEGAPQDFVLMVLSSAAGTASPAQSEGDLLVGASAGTPRRVSLGPVPVARQLQAPPLPAFETMQLHLQTVHLRPGAPPAFGPTVPLTIL